MPDTGLISTLRGLAPKGAGCAEADPRLMHPLWPGEALPGAIPRRLAEFSAGRAAAREAMAAIGRAPAAIPQGEDRAPVWPPGVIGSITHTATACLAIVLPDDGRGGIGLDLEPIAPLEPALWPTVLLPPEVQWLSSLPPAAAGLAAMEMFSAKEAAYKAQYRHSRQILGFEALRLDPVEGGFVARFTGTVTPFRQGDRIDIRLAHAGGHILTLATL